MKSCSKPIATPSCSELGGSPVTAPSHHRVPVVKPWPLDSGSMPEHATTPIATAELLAIGAELLVGETRDTNSGDLAGYLTDLGVEVRRMTQLPDEVDVIRSAVAEALERVDLVVTTGGLGPTPDDATREGIAAAIGERPMVDADLEAWLRDIWARRDLPFSDVNLKQAWLIPSASAMGNPHGTAPGWWVEHEGRIIIALPGPPRELQPMWKDHALPLLRARGLGVDRASETLRLTGIGESDGCGCDRQGPARGRESAYRHLRPSRRRRRARQRRGHRIADGGGPGGGDHRLAQPTHRPLPLRPRR